MLQNSLDMRSSVAPWASELFRKKHAKRSESAAIDWEVSMCVKGREDVAVDNMTRD